MDLSVGKLNHGLRADLVKQGISPTFAQETKKILEQGHNAFERLDLVNSTARQRMQKYFISSDVSRPQIIPT